MQLRLRVIRDDAALSALEPEWNHLFGRAPHASIFLSHAFVSLAWKHARKATDRLLVLTLHSDNVVRAIAPFRVTRVHYLGLPLRQVEWIAAWEGDRPGLLFDEDEAAAWRWVARFFATEYLDWDVLRLQEQPPGSLLDDALARVCAVDRQRDGIGHHIDLGTAPGLDRYLERVGTGMIGQQPGARQRLPPLSPGTVIERLGEPEQMAAALERFVTLESQGSGTDVVVGRSETLRRFYLELARALAAQRCAEFCFLRQGDRDLAAALLFRRGAVVYERHAIEHPRYASNSPRIALRLALLKQFVDEGCMCYDMLGIDPARGIPQHKADWATHQRETVTVLLVRRRGRMYLAWTATRLGRRLLARWRAGRAPSQASGEAQVAA